jgi:carbamate kinase
VRRPDGELSDIDGVVDKDLTSALLAENVRADVLLLLTDVSAVMRDWNTPAASQIREATAAELRALRLAEGSMGPKAEAACRFVERTGGRAVIGALTDAAAMLEGRAGTLVLP